MSKTAINFLLKRALQDLSIEPCVDLKVDIPPRKELGDYASNIAILCGRQLKTNPLELAQKIADQIAKIDKQEICDKVEVAKPGFINLFLTGSYLQETIPKILKQDKKWGTGDSAGGQRVLLEFVSANPTGPLHVGHGRWAVIGDVIARMLKAVGAKVETEFYVNNEGKQVKLLFESVKAVQAGKPVPEGGYGGEYIKDISHEKFANVNEVIDLFVKKQKQTLDLLDVKFDNWFYENELHDKKLIPKVIDRLKKLNRTFDEHGALWFKSEELGDDKNRVLVREDGQPTYFAADIAYHFEKYNRGYDKLINIWGTDHHGYVNRLKAAIAALDLPADKLEIIIGQLVTLYRGDEPIRMSKRTGEMVTLSEVIDEIGKDATRFFFAATDVNSHLDFDLQLAKKKSHENPVFYVQYAHARICSILKKSPVALRQSSGQASRQPAASPVEPSPVDLTGLTEPPERALIFKLMTWPDVVAEAARLRHPHRITEYGKELGAVFHSFYEKCRVLGNPARLALVDASRITLRNVLQLLGISAPESM